MFVAIPQMQIRICQHRIVPSSGPAAHAVIQGGVPCRVPYDNDWKRFEPQEFADFHKKAKEVTGKCGGLWPGSNVLFARKRWEDVKEIGCDAILSSMRKN